MSEYAILIPHVKTEYGEALLFELRSEKVRQPGEVCFPGGRMEAGETAVQAAVRETCEELGVSEEDIEIIAEHAPLIMGDGRIVHIAEALLRIDMTGGSKGTETGDPDRTEAGQHDDRTEAGGLPLSEDEVAEVFLIPLAWLKDHKPVHYDLSRTADEEMPDKLLGYLKHYGEYRYT